MAGGRAPHLPFRLNPRSPQAVGLLAWWPCLASRGTSLLREMVAARHASHNGGVLNSLAGELGWALDYEGVDDYASTDANLFTAADLARGAVSVWFQTSVTQTKVMVSIEGWIGIDQVGGVIKAYSDGAPTYANGTTPINDSLWHHAVATWDTTSYTRLYLDGRLEASATPANAALLDNTSRAMTFGAQFNGTSFWSGRIAEVRVYGGIVPSTEMIYQMWSPERRYDLYQVRQPLRYVPAAAGNLFPGSMSCLGVGR